MRHNQNGALGVPGYVLGYLAEEEGSKARPVSPAHHQQVGFFLFYRFEDLLISLSHCGTDREGQPFGICER